MRTFTAAFLIAAACFLVFSATTSVEAATTKKPTTLKPTTVKPTTKKPTTMKPTTMKPTTKKPTTMKPTTMKPTTKKPTTVKPTTKKPTTMKTTTMKPTTKKPTTMKPTTKKPTTMKPTTMKPTTVKPTTKKPTTMKPTTMKPTTMKPTTMKPTTMKPTTMKPTTVKPTTMKPTDATTPEPITDATTFDPVTSPEPITDATTFDPVTSPEPITDATTFDPATETTTLEPFSVSPATDYCNINTCSVPTDNTLCKYTNTTWGDACQPAYPDKSIVTDADIVTILAAHNDYRRKIAQGLETQGNPGPQPPASNMRELKWDQELAVMAAAHAQQCVFQHDTCRNVPRFQVGQNIYVGASSADNLGTSDWNTAVTEWYNEVQNMDATYAASFPASPPKVIGHYTQVVWADTYLVGCAVAYYQSTADFGPENPYNRLYVCNYGPTGNWVGSPVYSEGTAGSACPSDTANNDGLCA